MLRDLVAQARSVGSADLEAMTAERDFFKEKYVEQVDAMEALRGQLRESQRMIDRLRGQVLDLEVEKLKLEKQKLVEHGGGARMEGSGGSTGTATTCLSSDDDLASKSGGENNAEPGCNMAVDSDVGDSADRASGEADGDGARDVDTTEDDDKSAAGQESDEGEEDDGASGSEEDDEAEKIRANAARMLLWANYQTSKRSTPNTSVILDDESKTDVESGRSDAPPGDVSDEIVYSLPTSLDRRQGLVDDDGDSTLGSSSRHRPERSVGSWRSGNAANDRAGSGKIGKLLGNLRDMIDPPSESESEGDSDDESTVSNSH